MAWVEEARPTARNSDDIEQLIARINASERLRAGSRYSSTVYRDEPIVRTGRQLMDEREAGRHAQESGGRGNRSERAQRQSADAWPHAEATPPVAARQRATSRPHVESQPQSRAASQAQPNAMSQPQPDAMPQLRLHAQSPAATQQTTLDPLATRYHEMRSVSRWQECNGRGRWLTEAELFVKQGRLIADLEDDRPYHGTFKSYFPTYNAMSDQQLRGYVTWRTAVRRGEVQETSLSFAYVYLYEFINGIGVSTPLDGFMRMRDFWHAYRDIAPEMDRFARVWLRDYVVYHGLGPQLLDGDKTLAFDRALMELRTLSSQLEEAAGVNVPYAESQGRAAETAGGERATRRRSRRTPALPLPPDSAFESRLLEGIDALSTYRIRLSRLYKDCPDDLRHVACAVYVRMLEYYRHNRKSGLLESLFGEEATMPYTMFASAVFYDEHPHPDAVVELDPIHRYRCEHGLWSCTRVYGTREKSPKLGAIMRACDRKLRSAMGYPHPLKAHEEPKYLERIIDREITEWLEWKAAHAPRIIDIDLSKLSGIRSAAAETREALLIDEERDDAAPTSSPAETETPPDAAGHAPRCEERTADSTVHEMPEDAEVAHPAATTEELPGLFAEPMKPAGARTATGGAPTPDSSSPLSPEQTAYLAALLEGTPTPLPPGTSEDMLVDAINEALFDELGDTAIEFGPDGPQVIDDYEDDVRGLIAR
ncbi:TerB N-terminal domain-containing protein [Collinsella sp. An2]|uniref:TerB N-terminal domain-containing protein n=1 Tax=Collinsella sp. An2 TaxID=1965585 RepID=UPI000B3A56F4|nr:TerB N-terminal domain-containing protein [Collinsella sp. An2]